MGLTNDMMGLITDAILGQSITAFDNANAAIGVGDDSTAFSSSQSQLQAEANGTSAIRKGMDSGYPSQDPEGTGDANKARYQATFTSSEGNFKWEEWGIFNSSTSGGGTMQNREVEYLGEKSNNVQWVYQVDISLVA